MFTSFWQLSCPEKKWVVFHPFVACKAFRITKTAKQEAEAIKKDSILDGDADGGQVDAFRHAYWMALLSQKMKAKKALKLGRAHERGNYKNFLKGKTGEEIVPDSAAMVMDLFNNQAGSDIGNQHKDSSQAFIKQQIIGGIKLGKMKIILKNKQGHSLTCEGEKIPVKNIEMKWNTPRCVVESNTEQPLE